MIFNAYRKNRTFRIIPAVFVLMVLSIAVHSCIIGREAVNDNKQAVQNSYTGLEKRKIPFPRPVSHRGNWPQYHGASVDFNINNTGQGGNTCLACHERNDCIVCHNTQMPRDHINTWRTLSHGFTASGDRDRCMICHKQDYCVRCHNETAPRTHKGNWRDRHCSWCHFGSGTSSADNCSVCHRSAPHTSAPHPLSIGVCSACH